MGLFDETRKGRNATRSSLRGLCCALTLAAFVIGCGQVPITHRKGLRLVPGSQLLALSFQQYADTLKKSTLSQDTEEAAMVRTVGEKIAGSAEEFLRDSGEERQISNYQWEFNLIEDDSAVNAWCMPGGKVAVYTGILPVTKDETGLAVVVGHEVAHAIADHGNERMSQGLLTEMGGMALSVALAQKPQRTRELFMTAFGIGANVGFVLPYSRLHESEADQIGLMLMARAGYDPREAIAFWERMEQKGGSRPPEFLSTHPASGTRIANIKAHVAEALPYYEKSKK